MVGFCNDTDNALGPIKTNSSFSWTAQNWTCRTESVR